MCGWAVATALGHSHTVGVGESGHELGNGCFDSLAEQRALCATQPTRPDGAARVSRSIYRTAVTSRGKLRACVQLGTRWQPLSTPPTLWAWVGVGMGWGAGAMFGYDSLWPYNARARLCAPPTATAASWGDRRSAALAASPARAASNAPRHALLRPHGEPPAAAGLRPMAASSTPQPRRERPRADRRHRPPRPPPGAIRGSSRISGAHCVECAAARSAVTAQRATSRGRASARCTSCHAHPLIHAHPLGGDGSGKGARPTPPPPHTAHRPHPHY